MSCLNQFSLPFQLPMKTQPQQPLSLMQFMMELRSFFFVTVFTTTVMFILLKATLVYLCFSCVSLMNLFSSSILSAVSLRTITSSTVSTTSPFSPRFRLQATNALLFKAFVIWHILSMHVSTRVKICYLF